MLKVCFCPATLAWITKHLRKDAKKAWRNLIKRNSTTTTKVKTKSKGKSKSKGGGKRKQSAKQKAAIARFTRAAKKCRGKGKGFRPCMKKELKKRR